MLLLSLVHYIAHIVMKPKRSVGFANYKKKEKKTVDEVLL